MFKLEKKININFSDFEFETSKIKTWIPNKTNKKNIIK